MTVVTTIARTKGEFKDLILDNVFVITRNAAQLFDNLYRDQTHSFADDLGHCFELLIHKIDRKDALSIPEPLWCAYMLLWQAANTLVAAYQSIRVGFPVEAIVITRHALELQALALQLFLEPGKLKRFKNGSLGPTRCITAVKKIFPNFGKQYGLLSDIAHPKYKTLGTHLHQEADGRVVLLIGAGLPGGKPRLVRSATTRLLVGLVENQSSLLHASIELLSLEEVLEAHYWKKTEKGIVWNPSDDVQSRWAARMEVLQRLLGEATGELEK